jgi:KUP system potassium uptake protein
VPAEAFIASAAQSAARVPGTGVFLTSQADGIPHSLSQNMKHNRVLHERSLFLRVAIEDIPYVAPEEQATVQDLGQGFYRVTLRRGFMEEMNVPEVLKRLDGLGGPLDIEQTSFFLSRQTPLATEIKGMMLWRERLFGWMMRNAESPMEFFCLPSHRVVEMGSQVKI